MIIKYELSDRFREPYSSINRQRGTSEWRGLQLYECMPEKPPKKMEQLSLNKGTEKFIFRYERDCEDELLDALINQAKNKHTDFDWFDAAVVSFKLTAGLIGQANAEEFLYD